MVSLIVQALLYATVMIETEGFIFIKADDILMCKDKINPAFVEIIGGKNRADKNFLI